MSIWNAILDSVLGIVDNKSRKTSEFCSASFNLLIVADWIREDANIDMSELENAHHSKTSVASSTILCSVQSI